MGAFLPRFSLSMASMATSADDDAARSEAPSTCGHWTASDDEDEEEVVEVGDVATLLPNENVQQVDVCESGVPYELEDDPEAVEVESEVVVANTGIAEEIEVDYEEMPQAAEAQDVVVPPTRVLPSCQTMLVQIVLREMTVKTLTKELVDENRDKAKELMHELANALGVKLVPKPLPPQPQEDVVEEQYETVRIRFKDNSSHASGSSTASDTTVRKSTRNGKKRMVLDTPSDDLEIIGQRATIEHDFGSDFLVKKHDKPDSWWVYEDELRNSDRGCEAMEVFDKKRRRK